MSLITLSNKSFIPFSIRAKILILVTFLVLMLVFAGLSLQSALNSNRDLIERQSDIIHALTILGSAHQDYGQLRWSYLTFLSQPNPTTWNTADKNLTTLKDSLDSISRVPLQAQVQVIEEQLEGLRNNALVITDNSSSSSQIKSRVKDSMNRLSEVDAHLNALGDELKKILAASSGQTLEKTQALQRIPLMFILGGLMTVAFVLAVVVLDIFVPVRRITNAMMSASLDTENARDYVLQVDQEDELGRATYALNHLLREVSSGIERILSTESKLRETGQYLQTIMDSLIDGLIIVDMNGTIESFSPGAETILGYKEEEVLGQDFSRTFPSNEDDWNNILAQLQNPDSGDYKTTPHEINVFHKSKSLLPVELLVGTASYNGKPMNVVTVRDISFRKNMENLLNQAQRMETIGRMSGGIAHDFNNMLIVISGNLELIERRVQGQPELKEMIDDALKSVNRGKELTQRILAFSRKQVLKPQTLNINERLPDIIELIRRAVSEDVAIETVLGADLWDIHVDPAQMESALLNLAINSRDAIAGNEGRITIITKNFSFHRDKHTPFMDMKPGDYVMISVSDNGSGIQLDDINQVFEPFFTTKEVDKGTGLGLSMVYGFTTQSGGHITISSLPGKGTTVKLFFPRSFREKKEIVAANDRVVPDTLQGNRESLLVVEDQSDVLKYLTTTLRELGYRVTSAKDGPSALKRMQSRRNLDLLVTDVVMPGHMDGEELATEIRKKFPKVKTLYISGYTSNALIEKGSLKNDVDLLSKPFTRAELAQYVRKALGK